MEIRVTPKNDPRTVFASVNSGDTVFFESGIYRFTEPIVISGKKDIRIKGDGAVITGCTVIQGEWKEYREGILLTKTRSGLDIQQLYVNGRKYVMARYPNEEPDKILGGYSADALSSERASRWKNPATGYVRALHSYEWGGNDYFIDGRNSDGSPVLRWVGDNNRGDGHHPEKVMVENIFEELDAPGEWFYDKNEGLLFVIPEIGDTLPSSLVEGAVCGELFKLKDCENISFTGLSFKNTKRMLFCSRYEKITRSDWAVARNGAVYVNNCENIRVSDCEFSHTGGNCVFIDGKNADITVDNCDFTDCGASGVCVFGNQDCVRDLSTWENSKTVISDFEPGPKKDDFPVNTVIKDCYFYNLGEYEKQSAAITMSVCSRVTVDGCTIHKVPRAGINICDGSFGGHRIINNLVFDTVLETGDHGPFNSWGRDRFWSLGGLDGSGKNGREKRPYATLDAVETTVIAHNMFCGNRGFGIDLDDGSSNYLITKNYCSGVGIKLREGFLRTVTNNFVTGAPLDIHCTFERNDDIIENNIVVSQNPLSVYAQNDGFTTKAINNLFAGADSSVLSDALFCGNKNYVCTSDDENALSMRPKDIYFEPFSLEFGRKDRPKPFIAYKIAEKEKTVKLDGITLCAVNDSIRSVAGLPDSNGAYVSEISSESAFFSAGVRKHDVILTVNGREIRSPADVNDSEDIKTVRIIRGQKPLDL